MNYTSPESVVFVAVNIVATSQENSNQNSGSSSGGIQLPFIPG